MDTKGEERSPNSPATAIQQNGTTDEPASQEHIKEIVNGTSEGTSEATQNDEAKVNGKIEDLSDDEDYKSCEGDLDGEREEERAGPEEKPLPPKSRSEERDSECEDNHRNPRDQK